MRGRARTLTIVEHPSSDKCPLSVVHPTREAHASTNGKDVVDFKGSEEFRASIEHEAIVQRFIAVRSLVRMAPPRHLAAILCPLGLFGLGVGQNDDFEPGPTTLRYIYVGQG
jgi:hypothetical protein